MHLGHTTLSLVLQRIRVKCSASGACKRSLSMESSGRHGNGNTSSEFEVWNSERATNDIRGWNILILTDKFINTEKYVKIKIIIWIKKYNWSK